MFKIFKKNLTGFTLIELLIAVAILGLISTALVGIFIQALKSQEASERMQNLQTDTRFLLERISQVARMGTLNYGADGYNGNAVPGGIVYLIAQDGEKLILEKSGDSILLNGSTNITPSNLKVDSLNFYPYPENPTDKEQRRVEMRIKVFDKDQKANMVLNLIVTSRVYDQW